MTDTNMEKWVSDRKAGKDRGEFYTPENLSRFVALLAREKNEPSRPRYRPGIGGGDLPVWRIHIYDPCVGGGELLIQAVKSFLDWAQVATISGTDISWDAVGLSQRRILAVVDDMYPDYPDKPEILISRDDFFAVHSEDEKPWADIVIMNPPWGCPWPGFCPVDPRDVPPLPSRNRGEWAYVLGALHEMVHHGTLVAILSPGCLYRSGSENKIRQYLIQKNLIDTVIELPRNMFPETAIPPVVVVLRPSRPETRVCFIQAKDEFERQGKLNVLTPENTRRIIEASLSSSDIPQFSRCVAMDELQQRDYSLSPGAYIEQKDDSEKIDIDKLNRECVELRERNNRDTQVIDALIEEIIND